MSETSSDSESSCGWTIISNEGSDIETLGPEAAVEYGVDLLERPLVEEAELQQKPASAPAVRDEQLDASQDAPLREQAEPRLSSEAGAPEMDPAAALCFSDHSDIVTLGELRDGEDPAAATAAPAASEEFYLGRSCSSQYAFTAGETVFPAQQPAATHSSSSEDEASQSPSAAVRRRRLRKNTASTATEPEDEEEEEEEEEEERAESEQSDEEEEAREEKQQVERGEIKAGARKASSSSILNRCIIIALVIAISMGYGHFHGTLQTQERQKMVEKVRVNELDDNKDLLHMQKLLQQEVFLGSTLQSWLQQLKSEVKQVAVKNQRLKNKLKREEQLLSAKWEELRNLQQLEAADSSQVENRRMSGELEEEKQPAVEKDSQEREELWEELRNLRSNVQHLEAMRAGADQLLMENQSLSGELEEEKQLKNSPQLEERSLTALWEELRNLRSNIQHLEAMRAGADLLRAENGRLSGELEEEKQLALSAHRQMEAALTEAQELRWKLEVEKKVAEELRRESARLRSRVNTEGSDGGELRSRLAELEKRLSFEQQRSDLWERLYVESKEDRAKGDTEAKVKKPKKDLVGKVKDTFDAIKNSTKEFVHHHKEQIKKVKEAVKENLRKFSDSVKSLPTFYQWKDSAASFINKARGFYKKTEEQAARPPRGQPHGFGESFQSNHNTRKPGPKVHNERGHKVHLEGCGGLLECTLDRVMEPIRADEFHLLLQSYLQQQVDHFHHWKELEAFVNSFFFNGVFIHDRMLFTDFISGVEDYLADMHEYHGLDDHVFGDLDDYVYRHYFGEAYAKSYGPSGPFERPDDASREESRSKQQRKQQRARPRPHSQRKWSRTGGKADPRMADVKIELGPMPFDPKY